MMSSLSVRGLKSAHRPLKKSLSLQNYMTQILRRLSGSTNVLCLQNSYGPQMLTAYAYEIVKTINVNCLCL